MMPNRIYGVGYRKLEGPRPTRWTPWPIARTALVLAWRDRASKLALMVCGLVVFGHGLWLVTQLLADRALGGSNVTGLLTGNLVGQTQEVFGSFLTSQFFTTALALAVISGGLIAEDRRQGAINLYFSRPLRRLDYAAGKLLAAALIPTATIIVPVGLLWLAAVGIAPPGLRGGLWSLALPACVSALGATAVLSTTIVGLSALGERGRTVGVTYILGLMVLAAAGEALASAGIDVGGYLAPERDLRTIVEWLLQVTNRSVAGQLLPQRAQVNESVLGSFAGLCAFVGGGLFALTSRLKREVVG